MTARRLFQSCSKSFFLHISMRRNSNLPQLQLQHLLSGKQTHLEHKPICFLEFSDPRLKMFGGVVNGQMERCARKEEVWSAGSLRYGQCVQAWSSMGKTRRVPRLNSSCSRVSSSRSRASSDVLSLRLPFRPQFPADPSGPEEDEAPLAVIAVSP